jgi:hypothetical protein
MGGVWCIEFGDKGLGDPLRRKVGQKVCHIGDGCSRLLIFAGQEMIMSLSHPHPMGLARDMPLASGVNSIRDSERGCYVAVEGGREMATDCVQMLVFLAGGWMEVRVVAGTEMEGGVEAAAYAHPRRVLAYLE